MIHWKIGDCLDLIRELDANSIDCIVTSPPYFELRDYGVEGQVGQEDTLNDYHSKLLQITLELYRVLKPSGVMFWNHGDSYNGSKHSKTDKKIADTVKNTQDNLVKHFDHSIPIKSMMMQNERLIIKMIDNQKWILRNRIIWNKPNAMPSSVTDRFSNKYESVYMLTKDKNYWFDLEAVKVPFKGSSKHTKNPGDVWTIPTQPYPNNHFATFPINLIKPMIKAGCSDKICPTCGHISKRITKKIGNSSAEYMHGRDKNCFASEQGQKQNLRAPTKYYQRKTKIIGYTSCDCNTGLVSGTVLDPFCGSGTVLKACRELNRNGIGFELNPDYEIFIKKRCETGFFNNFEIKQKLNKNSV